MSANFFHAPPLYMAEDLDMGENMLDRSLSISLIVIFGLSGLAMLLAAWTMPFMHEERLTACIAGGIGLGFAAIRWVILRQELHRKERVTVEVRERDSVV